ncbi:class I glutamine amidotransferase-like protein [Sordaria brevicollis]|uniref:Class I glutamine amidotransferase-like protein n=1 Tax=Sordaria brevicollis TaxID=83679 RepID=A0AAE0P1T5_SORBR|nr:class I glutamine amidotransferase-like protein [Sordaria brevicollis]
MTASTDSPSSYRHEVNPHHNDESNAQNDHQNNATKIPLRIAILLNSYRSPHISSIRDSYTRCFSSLAQSSTCRFEPRLSFFYPADNFYCCSQGPHNDREGCNGSESDASLSSDCSNLGRGSDSESDSPAARARARRDSRIKEFLPDPADFDLIVIGGGNADPRKKHAWILRVHEFIRQTRKEHPEKKIVGVCWGHQTLGMVLGEGKTEVGEMGRPELGVTDSKLTPAGVRFFNDRKPLSIAKEKGTKTSLRLHQHHRRQLTSTPPNFHQLLANNECLLSDDNSVLTFQGHPEKDAKAAKLKIRDAARWWGWDLSDEKKVEEVKEIMEREHDGNWVMERVLEWVWEGVKKEEGDEGVEWKL